MSKCGTYTLSELVDEYLANRMIDKKKNYASYLVIAKRAWQHFFMSTVWSTQSTWETLRSGDPYNYVEIPKGCARFFSAAVQDCHGKIQPLFYNGQINVVKFPSQKSCGYSDCEGFCDDLDGLQVNTKLVFTINGINYYEKDWIKYCRNGDLIKWREVPVKKYNDFVGQSGDYNNDFNNDFSIGNPGTSNFEIITQTFQEIVCKLETRPCGCPLNTTNNVNLIHDHCGCYFPAGHWSRWNRRRYNRETFLDDINSNGFGSVKISPCGTMVYYIPPRRCDHFYNGKYPEFLLLNWQTNGLDCTDQVQVPDYDAAVNAMFTDIDWRSKRFNGRYSLSEKQEAKFERNDAENKLIGFLNPLNLQEIANVQDAEILW